MTEERFRGFLPLPFASNVRPNDKKKCVPHTAHIINYLPHLSFDYSFIQRNLFLRKSYES